MPRYRANFQKDSGDGQRKNSLGLDSRRLNLLFDHLDAKSQNEQHLKRVFVRWPFRQESIAFRVVETLGGKREFRVAARNLSNGGAALVHNAYIHPGTDCEVDLPSQVAADAGGMTVRGKVTRCQHIQGVVHEIGVRFTDPVDSRLFLSLDSMPAYYSLEMIDADRLEGNILHVEDSALDRRLFAHYLADTRIIVKSASTIAEAKERAAESFDLIVADQQLPDGMGTQLVNDLRESGILTPVVMLTADSTHAAREQFARAEINGVLTKPVDQGTLLRAITEFLSMNGDGGTVPGDESLKELTGTFVAEMASMVEQLQNARKVDDAMAAYSIALRLKGTAPALGFDRLANIADRAGSILAASMSCEESSRQLDALIDACERVRHRRAI